MLSQYRPMRPSSHHQSQRGGALLMAMVIVTLVTTMAASMVWMQWRAVQVESAERSLVQSQWVLRGFLDYGRIILREDARNGGQDHLGEQWAVPLEEVSIASFLSADKENSDDAPEGFLSGRMVDATARYHLYNLIDFNVQSFDELAVINPQQLVIFKRLCEFAGVSPAVADQIAQNLRKVFKAWLQTDLNEANKPEYRTAPLRPQTLDQLVWLGVDAGTIERLRPFVVVFPIFSVDAVPVNVNTASREVLAAVVPGLDLARADRLVQARQKKPFVSVSDIQSVVGQLNLANTDNRLSTNSKYFELQGRMRLSDRVLVQRYIVEREDGNVRALVDNTVFGVETPNTNGKGP